MKTRYLIVSFILLVSFSIKAQNHFEQINCTIELTIKEILSESFEKDCVQLKNQTIISFKVKIPKRQTIIVTGSLFNDKASGFISKAKTGDHITLFDIKVKSNKVIQPIVIAIKE